MSQVTRVLNTGGDFVQSINLSPFFSALEELELIFGRILETKELEQRMSWQDLFI